MTKTVRRSGLAFIAICSVSLLAVVLTHVYLFSRGVALVDFLTFWLPLELASFLILIAIIFSDDAWVFALIIALAAVLHLILIVGQSSQFQAITDPIYGYQLVDLTLSTGRWAFNAGTGQAQFYSFFPFIFIFTALWSGIGSIPPVLLVNFGFAFVNLASFLSIRMLAVNLLSLSKRQVNLVLFLYALTPAIHAVEAHFHYEAYAIVFFPLVLLYALKPKVSPSERIVGAISILAIALSHYFTAYILLLNAVVLAIAYVVIKGTRIHLDLLFMTIVTPLAVVSGIAVSLFGLQVLTVQSILSHIKSINSLLSKLTAFGSTPSPTYYPAPWFADMATARNITLLLLGLLSIVVLCLSRRGFKIRIQKHDMLTYLAATWLFSVFFSVASYYGVAWAGTTLVAQGSTIARQRIAEFAFVQFAVFAGLGLYIVLERLDNPFRGRRLGQSRSRLVKMMLSAFLIVIFVSSAVVQAYPRRVYDPGYVAKYSDEYSATFQEPYYLGMWWYGAGNHSARDAPWSGSYALSPFVQGYGWQAWWVEALNSSAVNFTDPVSFYNTVYYGIDTLQTQRPDHLYNSTISPIYVSSNSTQLNAIFSTGRIIVVYKPAGA